MEKMQKENKRLKADQRARPRGQPSGNTNGNGPNRDKDNNKAQKGKVRPEWMFKPPPENEKTKEKKVSGKTYHWCDAAKVWGTHTASQCRAGREKHIGDKKGGDKRLRFSRALQAVAGEDESSAESNE